METSKDYLVLLVILAVCVQGTYCTSSRTSFITSCLFVVLLSLPLEHAICMVNCELTLGSLCTLFRDQLSSRNRLAS
jgi:hypothetical protein